MGANFRIEKWTMPHAPNAAMLRLLLEREGYRIDHFSSAPGTLYGNRKNSDEKCHWMISGEIEVSIYMGATYRLTAGDRDYIAAETNHTMRIIGDEPAQFLVAERASGSRPSAAEAADEESEPTLPPGVAEYLESMAAQARLDEMIAAALAAQADAGDAEPTAVEEATSADAESIAEEDDE